ANEGQISINRTQVFLYDEVVDVLAEFPASFLRHLHYPFGVETAELTNHVGIVVNPVTDDLADRHLHKVEGHTVGALMRVFDPDKPQKCFGIGSIEWVPRALVRSPIRGRKPSSEPARK